MEVAKEKIERTVEKKVKESEVDEDKVEEDELPLVQAEMKKEER